MLGAGSHSPLVAGRTEPITTDDPAGAGGVSLAGGGFRPSVRGKFIFLGDVKVYLRARVEEA